MKVRERYEDYIPRKLRGLFFNPGVPLISGGGGPSGVDIGYPITKSARFRASATAYLSRATSTGSTQIATAAFFVKRGLLGDTRIIRADVGGTAFGTIYFDSNDKLNWFIRDNTPTTLVNLVTTRVFRDPSKWYFILCSADSTQATAANRIKIEVNGVQETAFDTAVYPSLNQAMTLFGNGNTVYVGRNGSGVTPYFDGYLAEVIVVDGQQLTSSSFGRVSADTGAWVPKNYTGTYGTNGFRLRFLTGAVASDLGIDSSGNGNTFTVTNMSVTAGVTNDWSNDTPTNTFPTWNPLQIISPTTLSGGNLNADTGAAGGGGAYSNVPVSAYAGDWYVEITPTAGTTGATCRIGISDFANTVGVSYEATTGNKQVDYGASVAYGATFTDNDVIGVRVNSSGVTFYKNGASQGLISYSLAAGKDYYIRLFDGSGSLAVAASINCGQRAFNSLPSGSKSLCTANLPTPSVLKGSNGFVAVSDTGTNIQTTLATARAGWGADPYVELFKDRSASQGWRWRFSTDSANSLDSTSTAAKVAFPALTGGDTYEGLAIRISSAYGTASGTVSHTNGVADTITHNLGNARCLIILKREDGVSNWFVYHPDLVAGQLGYLNLTTGPSADTTITSVGANSFQIGSGAPTGVYRYLICVPKTGLFSLTSSVGNSSTDGQFIWETGETKFGVTRNISSTMYWVTEDNVRNTSNPKTTSFDFANLWTTTETSVVNPISDHLSGGRKMRNNNATYNAAGNVYIHWAWLERDFKYANAR